MQRNILRRFLTTSSRFAQSAPTYFTKSHEWIRIVNSQDSIARIGITKHAADQLGQIAFLDIDNVEELMDDGELLETGEPICDIESSKSASEISMPVSGTVVGKNDDLDSNSTETMNSAPEGDGYLCEIKVADLSEIEGLMDGDGYKEFLAAEK